MERNLFDDHACEQGHADTTAFLRGRIAALHASADRGPIAASYVIGAFYGIVQLIWSQRAPSLSPMRFLAIVQRHAADAVEHAPQPAKEAADAAP